MGKVVKGKEVTNINQIPIYAQKNLGDMIALAIEKHKLKKIQELALTDEEINFLKYLDSHLNRDGVLRILLSTDEIKSANKLVKKGLINKGVSDAKNGTTMFYINPKGEQYLQSL